MEITYLFEEFDHVKNSPFHEKIFSSLIETIMEKENLNPKNFLNSNKDFDEREENYDNTFKLSISKGPNSSTEDSSEIINPCVLKNNQQENQGKKIALESNSNLVDLFFSDSCLNLDEASIVLRIKSSECLSSAEEFQKEKVFLIQKKYKSEERLLGNKRKNTCAASNKSEEKNATPKTEIEKRGRKPKANSQNCAEKESVNIKKLKKKLYLQGDNFPKLNENFLAKINARCFKKIIAIEKKITQTKKVTNRMKNPDAIDKKIHVFIRRFLSSLFDFFIDNNTNFKRCQKIGIKKKLLLADLSYNVSIKDLKALHGKSLKQMFTAENFISKAKLYKYKNETLENFEKRKVNSEIKKAKKFIYAEKKLSVITQIPLFRQIENIRINEIYKQTIKTEIIEKELTMLRIIYPSQDYCRLLETRIKDRSDTFNLIGNKNWKQQQKLLEKVQQAEN